MKNKPNMIVVHNPGSGTAPFHVSELQANGLYKTILRLSDEMNARRCVVEYLHHPETANLAYGGNEPSL